MKKNTDISSHELKQCVSQLLEWFDKNKRDMPWREIRTPYRSWVSEVMLQQTQVDTVIPYFERFMKSFPDIKALADADSDSVLKLWEGLGYYNRIRNFHKAAKIVVDRYNGVIPMDENEFRSLPGVGPYICAAVLSMVDGQTLPVLDGNVARVISRFSGCEHEIQSSSFKKWAMGQLEDVIPGDRPGDFNEAMMELGALVCRKASPECSHCPLSKHCHASEHNMTDRFPVVRKKEKVPHYKVAVALIEDGDRLFIQKRPHDGHLGGLWEFPGGKVKENESPEHAVSRECEEELNASVTLKKSLPPVKHAYSHFKVTIFPYVAECAPETIHTELENRWIDKKHVHKYAFPKANHKIFSHYLDLESPE